MTKTKPSNQESFAEAIASAEASVVGVRGSRVGSGFAYLRDGAVATSARVVGNEKNVSVRTADGDVFEAKVVGRDFQTDLALLSVPELAAPPLPIREVDGLRVGDAAIALGRPGRSIRASSRIIGLLARDVKIARGERLEVFLETDRALPRGFAGGPLIDARGGLIGLSTRHAVRGADLAITGTTLARVLGELDNHGGVRRGYLGVSVLRAALGDGKKFGALICAVEDGSAAQTAGLLLGDVLVSVGGEPVAGPRQLAERLAGEVGAEIDIELIRAGQPLSLRATVGTRSAS